MRRFIFALFLTIQASFVAQAQLGTALNTNLTWTTSTTFGSPDWNTTSSQSLDGLAAVSRTLFSPSFKTATLQTTVTGPGTLTFWSMIPLYSTANLYFVVGSSTQAVLFASTGAWEQTTVYIGSGTQTLKWIYASGPSGSAPACYLDVVAYAPGSTAPFITSQPPSQSQIPELPTTFTVLAQGTPPLRYQWQFDGAEIPGATNEFYTLPQTQITNLGAYRVVITNSVNSVTSSIASLEFGHTTAWGLSVFNQTAVPPGATNLLAIAANGFNMAIKSDHTLIGWGDNRHGQLTIPSDATNIIGIAAGWSHALALRKNGTVLAWGLNDRGQTNVPGDLTNVVSVAAGTSHSVALKSDGSVVAWGYNGQGQTNVPSGLTNVVAISTFGDHILALRSDGQVVPWGQNFSGQTNIPAELLNVVRIAAGTSHSVALKSDGTIVAWGSSAPNVTNVPIGLSNAVAIAAGLWHTIALKADGTITAWGWNIGGETNVPTGLAGSIIVAAGMSHSLAMKTGEALVLNTVVTNASFSNATFSIEVPSQCNRVFELQFKDDLTNPEWTSLPLLPGNGSNLLFTDTTAPAAGRFYRIRRW